MTVDIYIREKSGKREIRIPLLPEEIEFLRGDATFISSDIMNLGEVAVPSGTELTPYSWTSEFPGALRKNDPLIRGSWQDPKKYDSILEDWKSKGTLLNLLVTGYPINDDVYLKTYHGKGSGAFGDIVYEVEFIEAREITIKTTKVATTSTKRAASTSRSYTIKSGDTLWGIAKKFYGDGTKWKTIYNANKDIIERTAKKYGKSSSNNGWWIYPGVTLTIPNASGSSSASSGSGSGGSSGSNTSTKSPSASNNGKIAAYTSKRDAGVKAMVSSITKNQSKLLN